MFLSIQTLQNLWTQKTSAFDCDRSRNLFVFLCCSEKRRVVGGGGGRGAIGPQLQCSPNRNTLTRWGQRFVGQLQFTFFISLNGRNAHSAPSGIKRRTSQGGGGVQSRLSGTINRHIVIWTHLKLHRWNVETIFYGQIDKNNQIQDT